MHWTRPRGVELAAQSQLQQEEEMFRASFISYASLTI